MKKPILVIMAAGMGSRYGGLKQMDPVDKEGHVIMDFSLFDAKRAGFEKAVCIIKREMAEDFEEVIGSRVRPFLELEYAFQDMNALPEGYSVPEGRVKPWGTGRPMLVISARLAPLPPSSSRMDPSPSEKRYRYLCAIYKSFLSYSANTYLKNTAPSILPLRRIFQMRIAWQACPPLFFLSSQGSPLHY